MIPDEMLKKARKNLLLRSRTANGIVDTSINRDKAGILMIQSGDDAAKTASENFDDAIRYAWEERDAVLESPTDLRRLIESIAAKINKGTLKDGYLIRTLDTDRRSYVRCFALAGYMEDFYNTLFCKLAACPGNPVEEAAYTEYGIDIEGHFFGDGCGKSSMAAASWVLFRRGHDLPEYRGGRSAFYAAVAGFDEFYDFYKTLFTDE
ncbi:MAG: hypothetical protein IJ058_02680 [Lachnospiraceae bacterium]|nr:hypothetical protein [Lachnospiraceae bacterium]